MNRLTPLSTRAVPAAATLLLALAVSGCAFSAAHKAYLQDLQTRQIKPMIQAKAEKFDPLELSDIEYMVQEQVPDDQILYHLRRSKAVYYLSSADVERLQQAGVHSEIIDFLLQTPRRYAPPYYYYPYYYPPPYYYPSFHYYYGPYPYYYYGGGGIRGYRY